MSFWDRLYKGLGAEYFITGELFMAGYEAFKLPADFGLDLIVTSQRELSFAQLTKEKIVQPPYVFQVKSRRIKKFCKNLNGRPEASTEFHVKEEDWELLISDENAYLICVLIFRDDVRKLQNRLIYFWLHSSHLSVLQKRGYVFEIKDSQTQRLKYVLRVVLRLQATLRLEEILSDLVDQNELTESGKSILSEKLAELVSPRWNSCEYISLIRPSKGHSNDEVVRMIPDALTSFFRIGEKVSLNQLN